MQSKNQKLLAAVLFVLITSGIGIATYMNNQNPIDNLDNMGDATDFTLESTTGDTFTLSDSNEKVRVLTFIYTKCNAGCSTITSKMATLRDNLQNEGLYSKVQMITIDFDFMHDTMDDLKEYRSLFTDTDDSWQFLFGDKNEIMNVTQDYNFSFELEKSPMNHTMNDTSTMEMTGGEHSGHSVVYVHPFVVWFIDGDQNIRAMKGGLDWSDDNAFNIVDFLIHEE